MWSRLDPNHDVGDLVVFASGSWIDCQGNLIDGFTLGIITDVRRDHHNFKIDVYVPKLDLVTTDWGESVVVSLDDYSSDADIYSKNFKF